MGLFFKHNVILEMRKLENNELDRKSIEDFKTLKTLFLFLMMLEVCIILDLCLEHQTLLIEKIYFGINTLLQIKKHKTALGATETVNWEHQKKCT
jgi:hypothetical protein